MIKVRFVLGTALIVAAFSANGADKAGQNNEEKAGGKPAEHAESIERLSIARTLAVIGLDDRDPLALITAARMIASTPVSDSDYEKQNEPGATTGDPAVLDTPQSLLARAREFSDGDAEILALIDETPLTAPRGRVGGPVQHQDAVKAGSTDLYKITFDGQRDAQIAVIGIGGDIDCKLFDEKNNLIDQDIDNTSTCALSFRPIWKGEFTLKIRNYASRDVPYALLSN